MSNLLLSVMGAFAQFERELIRERQREGIAIARREGKSPSSDRTFRIRFANSLYGSHFLATINI